MTGAGIVLNTPPNFPKNANKIANPAAIVINLGSNFLINVTAPVTSEYVVLGGPPNIEAKNVATPSPSNVL